MHIHPPREHGRRRFAGRGRGPGAEFFDGFGGGFGGSRGRHGGGAFGDRGHRRRRFDAESLRLVVLVLAAQEPRHGYDIIRAIEALTGGAYAPSPGVIYPMLSLLAEMGLIAQSAEDRGRRSFAITAEGQAHLAAHADEAEAAVARLKALAAPQDGVDAAPLRRAMANLSAVLQARLREEGTDKARLLDIAALIDEAASKIERL